MSTYYHFSDAQMHSLSPYRIDTVPTVLLPFCEAVRATATVPNAAVHFFIADRRFLPIFHCPDCYVESLRRYSYVIMPDLSQYRDYSAEERFRNHCRNRAIGAYWQSLGIPVIANVTWSLPDSYDYAFEGLPCHTTIAINSNGANADGYTRYLWLQGYHKAVERLAPTHILRYGSPVPGECTDISTYYPNPYIANLRTLPCKHKMPTQTNDIGQTSIEFD